jgi:uncharacterized protein
LADAIAYLDTSALAKLVVRERESAALLAALAQWPQLVTSALAEVELLRAVRRGGATAAVVRRAREVLAQVHLLAIDAATRQVAALLEPPSLRSLDAIHLASAMALGPELAAFVGYDRRLLEAAAASGLTVASPGL